MPKNLKCLDSPKFVKCITRLEIWLGGSIGNSGQPLSNLQARLKTQSCAILYALQDYFPHLFSSCLVFCNIQFKLGLGKGIWGEEEGGSH